MSILLDELIKDRKSRAIAYEEYLKKVIDLAKQAKEPQNTSSYPSSLNTPKNPNWTVTSSDKSYWDIFEKLK